MTEAKPKRLKKPAAKDVAHIVEALRPLAVSLADLLFDPRNARKHDERNIEEIAKSLDRYGQRTPIVVNRSGNVILKGNGTAQALALRGRKFAAVVWVEDDPTTAAGYALSDNRTAELASWDETMLQELLAELDAEGVAAADLGFTDEDLSRLVSDAEQLAATALGTPPSVAAAAEKPQKPGKGADEKPDDSLKLFQVLVTCEDAEDREAFLKKLWGEGRSAQALIA